MLSANIGNPIQDDFSVFYGKIVINESLFFLSPNTLWIYVFFPLSFVHSPFLHQSQLMNLQPFCSLWFASCVFPIIVITLAYKFHTLCNNYYGTETVFKIPGFTRKCAFMIRKSLFFVDDQIVWGVIEFGLHTFLDSEGFNIIFFSFLMKKDGG